MRVPRIIARAALLLAVLPAARAAETGPVPETLAREDAWYALHLQGAHVGWQHVERRRVQEDAETAPRVRTETTVHIRMQRYGSTMEVDSRQVDVESSEGRPLSLIVENTIGAQKTVRRGTFVGDELRLVTTTAGGTSESVVPWPGGRGRLSYGADLLMWREGLEPGTSIRYPTFSADLGRLVQQVVEVVARRPDGLLILEISEEELPGQTTRVVFDPADWAGVEMESSILGVRLVRTARDKARDLSEEMPDLGFSSLVPVERRVSEPLEVDRAVYRIRGPAGVLDALELGDGGRQRVIGREEGAVRVEVRRGELPEKEVEDTDRAPAPDAGSRQPSPWIEADAPEVRAALAEALRETHAREERPAKLASRLAGWVHGAIEERGYDVGFATAAEVARDRRGDCTEHAVFLAALLRAAGIPSRVRGGLLYIDAAEPVFGFHMWTQAWLEGRWVDLDATLGDEEADALHLGLATSDLSDTGMGDLALMAPALGQIELEVLEVESEVENDKHKPGG